MDSDQEKEQRRKRKGFGSMDKTRLRELAKKASDASVQSGHRHAFTPEQARDAAARRWGGKGRKHPA